MAADGRFRLESNPVHLGRGGTVQLQPEFTGDPTWYVAYGERAAPDGADGRLVSVHSFSEPWDSWEVHPAGEELVVCIDGFMTLFQEVEGAVRSVILGPGEAIVNPPGIWHTADVGDKATALFITAGMGTETRPR